MAEYEKLTVVKLREELVKRGLPKTGVKAVLVQRLNEADEQSADTDTANSDAKAALSGGNDARKNIATPPAIPSEQPSRSPATIGKGVDTTSSIVKAVEIPQSDGPSAVRPKARATSEEEIQPPEDDSPDTMRVEPAEVLPDSEQPNKTAPTAPPDDEATIAEMQEAAPKMQIPPGTDPQIPSVEGQTPAVSSSDSAVTGEEMVKDIRKRKRRSLTPTPSDESIQKKAKIADGGANVKLPEDESMDDANAPPVTNAPLEDLTEAEKPGSTEDTAMENAPPLSEPEADVEADRPIDLAHAELVSKNAETDTRTPPQVLDNTARQKSPEAEEPPLPSEPSKAAPESPAKTSSPDARFKNLLPPVSRRESSPARNGAEERTDERVVSPALHPATTALYIRDILRPLHVDNLKDHLISLATPSNSSPDPGVIADFFLDSIRTHCLVRFGSVAAASRVRTGLHARVWPDEKNRKALWVDFVPEEKLAQWIEVENSSSGRGQTAKRYEVVYESEEDGVKAYLQLVGSNNTGGVGKSQAADSPKEAGVGVRGAPLGPRVGGGEAGGSQQRASKSDPDQGQGFQALDDLFSSTVAKPKIYYLPAPKGTVEKRMAMLAEGRGGGRREGMNRYTFDEGVLVDRGPEMPRGRGGFDRGRGGGSYRGYSDRGGGYRGDHRRDYRGDYGGGGGDYRSEYRRDRR
ncbi:MAG: hypothetical protein Q9168_005543 [Polycauliona sp. 1 TL-2023]